MNKFSVFIPMDGMRAATIDYFANNAVIYLYDINARISNVTAPADTSDADLIVIGRELAHKILVRETAGAEVIFDNDELAYEFTNGEGVQLGWELVFYATPADDYDFDFNSM